MKADAMALRWKALGLMTVLLIAIPGFGYAQGDTYTISVTVVNPEGGSVSPGSQDVASGDTATFTVETK